MLEERERVRDKENMLFIFFMLKKVIVYVFFFKMNNKFKFDENNCEE